MQFLITGCSSGLGLSLANAVLAAGHKVIASSRNPSKTPQAVEQIKSLGGAWITLDVAAEDAGKRVHKAVEEYGPVDVLINNAGYASGGVLETYKIEDGREQMETNFFGVIRMIQAVLPAMRERKSGVIVNVSSGEAWDPHPVAGMYASSKCAVHGESLASAFTPAITLQDSPASSTTYSTHMWWHRLTISGLSESLYGELSPFGIRVLIPVPGGMATEFYNPANVRVPEIPATYKGTMADFVLQAIMSPSTKTLDTDKAAKAIVDEIINPISDPPVLRLPLGKESLESMKAKSRELDKTAQIFEKKALEQEVEG